MFLKNYRFWLSFQRRNEFCMQKYPKKHIFIGFAEKSHSSFHFCKKPIFLLETFRENHKKIENNEDKYIFFPYFACFSKTIDFGSVFSAEKILHAKIPKKAHFHRICRKKQFTLIFAKPIGDFSRYRPKN